MSVGKADGCHRGGSRRSIGEPRIDVAILIAFGPKLCEHLCIATAAQSGRARPVLDALQTLLDKGAKEDVLALVANLVARNEELEMALAKRLRGFKTTEKIPPNQLALLLELVATEAPQPEAVGQTEAGDANAPASTLGDLVDEERKRRATTKTKPPAQRPHRKRFPEALDREDNLIPVSPTRSEPVRPAGSSDDAWDTTSARSSS